MWEISERLYLGNYESAKAALSGITRPVPPSGKLEPFAGVVSLCPVPLFPDDPPISTAAYESTEWLLHPIFDGGNGEGEFEEALERALPFIQRRLDVGNVLVHCAAGMSRSVSVIAAKLCVDGADPDDAYRRIARAKAEALARQGVEQEFLIAPAREFRSCLNRLFAR